MKTRQWWGFACRENGEIDQEMHGDPRREMDGSNKDLGYESPSDTVVAGPLHTAVTATMGWTSWHESHEGLVVESGLHSFTLTSIQP